MSEDDAFELALRKMRRQERAEALFQIAFAVVAFLAVVGFWAAVMQIVWKATA